jgi:hypothetical protein
VKRFFWKLQKFEGFIRRWKERIRDKIASFTDQSQRESPKGKKI